MNTGDRTENILKAVVEEYVATGEPVGSKLLASQFGISPATIRNEMAELEEKGYLEQLYTSSGRVPTHMGYRYYVNSLMHAYDLSKEEIQGINKLMGMKIGELDRVMELAGKQISEITKYVSVVMELNENKVRIRRLDALYMDIRTFLLILITSTNQAYNKIFHSAFMIDDEKLEKIKGILNQNLSQLTKEDLNIVIVKKIRRELEKVTDVYDQIVEFIFDCMTEKSRERIYLEGVYNILNYPEYTDIDKARELLSFLDHKDEVRRYLGYTGDNMRIVIGRENEPEQMRDATVITANYKIGGKVAGTISVLGPTRMDYSRTLSNVMYFTNALNNLLEGLFSEKYDEEGDSF